jgi:hypothetical protein
LCDVHARAQVARLAARTRGPVPCRVHCRGCATRQQTSGVKVNEMCSSHHGCASVSITLDYCAECAPPASGRLFSQCKAEFCIFSSLLHHCLIVGPGHCCTDHSWLHAHAHAHAHAHDVSRIAHAQHPNGTHAPARDDQTCHQPETRTHLSPRVHAHIAQTHPTQHANTHAPARASCQTDRTCRRHPQLRRHPIAARRDQSRTLTNSIDRSHFTRENISTATNTRTGQTYNPNAHFHAHLPRIRLI